MILSCVSFSPDSVPSLNVCENFSSPTGRIPEGILEEVAVKVRCLGNAPLLNDSSRMEMRLLRETSSVFEYLCQHFAEYQRVLYAQTKDSLTVSQGLRY